MRRRSSRALQLHCGRANMYVPPPGRNSDPGDMPDMAPAADMPPAAVQSDSRSPAAVLSPAAVQSDSRPPADGQPPAAADDRIADLCSNLWQPAAATDMLGAADTQTLAVALQEEGEVEEDLDPTDFWGQEDRPPDREGWTVQWATLEQCGGGSMQCAV